MRLYSKKMPTYGRDLRVGDWLDPTWNEGAAAIWGLRTTDFVGRTTASLQITVGGPDNWDEKPSVRVDGLYDVVDPDSGIYAGEPYWNTADPADPDLVERVAAVIADDRWGQLDEYQVRARLFEAECDRIDAVPRWRRWIGWFDAFRPTPSALQVLIAMGEVRATEMGTQPVFAFDQPHTATRR